MSANFWASTAAQRVVLLIPRSPRPGILNAWRSPTPCPTRTRSPRKLRPAATAPSTSPDSPRWWSSCSGTARCCSRPSTPAGLHIGNLLGELPAIAPITWVAQVMPLFFLAGGAAGAYGWRDGTPWGTWLFTRAQRLCRPVFWYLAAWTVGLLVARDDTRSGVRGGTWTRVRRTAVVPRRVPRRARLRSGADPAADVGVRSQSWSPRCSRRRRWSTGSGSPSARPNAGVANFLFVWLIPVVIGVAYARRLIGPRAALVAAASRSPRRSCSRIAGPYEVSLVVTGAERMSNVSPPTLLLALHCTWMSCVFVAAAGAIRRWAARPRVWRAVAVGNGGAMTLYLWHIPAIAVADVLPPRHRPRRVRRCTRRGFGACSRCGPLVFAVVMAVAFRLLSPLEHRRLPWWDTPVRAAGARSTAAGALICVAGVALVLMAKDGLSGYTGWTALGCFLAAAVAARLSALGAGNSASRER